MDGLEKKYNEIMESFKKDAFEIIRRVADDVHFEMMPFVSDDTHHNSQYRAEGIVKNILSGNYEIDSSGKITVIGFSVSLTQFDHDRLVDKLAERCSDFAAQQKIARLERMLEEAHSKNY